MKWSAGIVYQVDALKAVSARSGAFWCVLLLNGPQLTMTAQRGAAFADRLPDRGGHMVRGAADRLPDCRV